MGEIDEALQRLRATIAVQFGLNLADFLVCFGEKFALQFVEFRIHSCSPSCDVHAVCRASPRTVSCAVAMNFLLICHALFSIEAPWDVPRGCTPVERRRSTNGGIPRLRTTVTVYADPEYLNVLFHAVDDEVVAT